MTNALRLGRRSLGGLLLASAAVSVAAQTDADPLPSWRDGPRKRALLDFVAAVTREGGPEFVRPAERIAVFDNDARSGSSSRCTRSSSSCSTASGRWRRRTRTGKTTLSSAPPSQATRAASLPAGRKGCSNSPAQRGPATRRSRSSASRPNGSRARDVKWGRRYTALLH
jgi:hypothetical protein